MVRKTFLPASPNEGFNYLMVEWHKDPRHPQIFPVKIIGLCRINKYFS